MYDENELFNELFQTMKGGVNTAERIYDIIMKIEAMTAVSPSANMPIETAQDFVFTGQSTDLSYFTNNNVMSVQMIESIPDAQLRTAVKEEFNKAIHAGKLEMDMNAGTIKLTEKGKDFISKPEFIQADARNRQSMMAAPTQQATETIGIELNGTMQDLNFFRHTDTLDLKAVLRSGDVKTQMKILENFKLLQDQGLVMISGSAVKITESGKTLLSTELFKKGFGMGVEKAVGSIPAVGTVIVAATKAITEVAKAVASNGIPR